MERLWTPWRYSYVTGTESADRRKGVPETLNGWPADQDKNCVFCNMIAATDFALSQGMEVEAAEGAIYLVERGRSCFVCLNAFPYGTGHLLIVPYAHSDSLAALPAETVAEIMMTMQRAESCLREVYHPNGMNFGLNLGQAAGAGIAAHLHVHALPRWSGDVNFLTVFGETRILPETLEVSWGKLRSAMKRSAPAATE